MKKLLRIQLNTKEYQMAEMPEYCCNLGGRGLTSSIIAKEVPPCCDAFGPENKLIIAAGILAGTTVPNSGRLSIGAKSPLTGGIKESNAGGTAAHKLVRLGIQAVVLEGVAEELTEIKIDKNGVTFSTAEGLCQRGNVTCIEYCRQIFGDKVSVISIGPAGEMGLTASGISVTSPDFLPRMAARGGLGAVMGSKNVKVLVIDDKDGVNFEPDDKQLLQTSVKAFTKGICSHPLVGGLKAFGTPLLVNMINEMGAMSTKNYSQGQFDGAEKISGEKIADLMKTRPNAQPSHRCTSGCVIGCSQVFTDEEGNPIVSGLEYETLALMGANCLIDDIDVIATMNAECNDAGVDTMEVGGAVAMTMDAGLIPWGDAQKALELVREIGKGTENGKMIGNGCHYVGEKLGVVRIPTVKRQCLAGYDPRVLKGTGVTYATSTMGADHTCGNALPSPANPAYNPSAADGQAPVSQFLQHYFAAIDSLGMCLFAMLPPLDMPELQKHLIDCVGAVINESLCEDYLIELGASITNIERKFNRATGMDRSEDRLPAFFREEPLLPSGQTFDVSDEEIDTVNS
jgi:aldehyde:ferredoxin oxidoreductase